MTAPREPCEGGPLAEIGERILLCSVGLAPQIVTEAIFALGIVARPAWRPTRLHMLTTSGGAPGLRMAVLSPGGALDQLAVAWGAPWASALRRTAVVHAVETPGGDLADGAALAKFADASVALVRTLTASPDDRLHVCLAGGRKSAAAAMALAVALYGREQDRLSHLVVEDAYASHPLFFFPSPMTRPLLGRDGRMIDAKDGLVHLIDLPYPRLRAFAPKAARDYADAIAAAQASLDRLALTIAIDAGWAEWGGRPLTMPPSLLCWLATLADDLLEGGSGVTRVGASPEKFLRAYRRLRGEAGAGRMAKRLEDPLDPEWVEEKCSRLVASANRVGARPRGGPLIARMGRRASARYRLALDPAEIRWLGERLSA